MPADDNTKPVFSVITATYNRAHLLPRAINSVLNQSYQNFEMIIVDDGSQDNTEQVVKSFGEDKRIIYYRYPENKGLSVVWNKGLDLASGDYVAFLDDDDELLPDALETAAAKIAELAPKGVKTIWFDSKDFETGKITGKARNGDGYITYEDHLCGRVKGDFWTVIERNLFGKNKFDERGWGGAAGAMWLKVFYQAKVFHVAEVLGIIHREHGSTGTNDFRAIVKNKRKRLWTEKTFLEEYGGELKRLCPGTYGKKLAVLGLLYLLNGEKAEGRKTLFRSLRYRFSLLAVLLIALALFLNERQIGFLGIKFVAARNCIRNLITTRHKEILPKIEHTV